MTNLDDIRAMLDAITAGEWVATSNDTSVFSRSVVAFPDGTVLARIERDEDRAFIAAAPRIVRELVAEVDRLTAARDELAKMYGRLSADLATERSRNEQDAVRRRIETLTDEVRKQVSDD